MAAGLSDRARLLIGAALVLTGVAVFSAWRSFAVATVPLPTPVSVAMLDSLTPFLAPADDSPSLAPGSEMTGIISRDPFGEAAAPTSPEPRAEPVQAPKPAEVAEEKWVVYGTFISGSNRSAVINEALVKLGDTMSNGVRLTAVDRNSVVLTDARGKEHTVPVSKEGE